MRPDPADGGGVRLGEAPSRGGPPAPRMLRTALLTLTAAALGLLPACSPADAHAAFGANQDRPPEGGVVLVQGHGRAVDLLDYLPPDPAIDGSVDYTVEVQNAIDDAAGRTLVLPDFPILVSERPGTNWCLLVSEPMTIVGSPSSILRETQGATQILRATGVSHLRYVGFTLEGNGQHGDALAHGLLQVFQGTNVTIDGVTVRGSDADGIAIAGARDVRVVNCRVFGASKAALYLSDCKNGVVANNVVTWFGGHRAPGSAVVGAGIQLSSNQSVLCEGNVISDGVGMGIFVNAGSNSGKPHGTTIQGNRVENVANHANPSVSSGIFLANSASDRATQTLVIGNSIKSCARYGIYVERHAGASITGNSIIGSALSGILVGAAQDVRVEGNLVLNANVQNLYGESGIRLGSNAQRARVRDNWIDNLPQYGPGNALEVVADDSNGLGEHDLEPVVLDAAAPPTEGAYARGDRVHNTQPSFGSYAGWICIEAGSPGVWRPFGRIE